MTCKAAHKRSSTSDSIDPACCVLLRVHDWRNIHPVVEAVIWEGDELRYE